MNTPPEELQGCFTLADLVSWCAMNEVDFVKLAEGLETLRNMPPKPSEQEPDVPQESLWEDTENQLFRLGDQLEALGCGSGADVKKFGDSLYPADGSDSLDYARGGSGATARQLFQTVDRELKEQHFTHIPHERWKLLARDWRDWLGPDFYDRFPSAGHRNDLERALRCYAYGEGTACVFHLMMLFEAPVRAFKTAIGYDLEKNEWGGILRHYRNKFRSSMQDGDRLNRLDKISDKIGVVAQAWRNETMHCGAEFGHEEAGRMVYLVTDMVRSIAETMDENGELR